MFLLPPMPAFSPQCSTRQGWVGVKADGTDLETWVGDSTGSLCWWRGGILGAWWDAVTSFFTLYPSDTFPKGKNKFIPTVSWNLNTTFRGRLER